MPAASGVIANRVYPRVCGGTVSGAPSNQIRRGLSPRVRGNPGVTADNGFVEGSIPACAGEPAMIDDAASIPEVYPRVCGGTPGMPACWRRQ